MREYSDKEIRIREGVTARMEATPIYRLKAAPIVKDIGITRASFCEFYGSVFDVIGQIEDDILPGRPLRADALENREEAYKYTDGPIEVWWLPQ